MAENLPPGYSRETTIRIDRDGRFWHDGQPVEHRGLQSAFSGWIDVDPESGRYILRNKIHWVFVEADDAPLVVQRVQPGAPPTLELSDGSSEPLAATTLRIDGDEVPYCDVRGGKLPARFSHSAAFTLGEWLLEHPEVQPARVAAGQGAARNRSV